MSTHPCPLEGCPQKLPRHILACKRHWFMLSKPTRDRVWAAWRAVEAGGPMEDYLHVRDVAVAELNAKGRRTRQPTLF